MENELKRTIAKAVDEMNEKIELAKIQMWGKRIWNWNMTKIFAYRDTKLLNMKMELEKIQKEREEHLKTIKSDYENFQVQ